VGGNWIIPLGENFEGLDIEWRSTRRCNVQAAGLLTRRQPNQLSKIPVIGLKITEETAHQFDKETLVRQHMMES
jgi:hypothetical protein